MKNRLARALLWLAPIFATISSVPPADVVSWNEAETPAASPVIAGTPPSCAVTVANGSTPPGERSAPGHHGNGQLWTSLWPDGEVLIPPEHVRTDGSLAMKWPWWRTVSGQLFIEGRRLDAPAPPLRAEAAGGKRLDSLATPRPDIRYGEGPPGFQATALVFPTEGCWEVTGQVGEARLTFVVRVVRVERWPWSPTATAAASP